MIDRLLKFKKNNRNARKNIWFFWSWDYFRSKYFFFDVAIDVINFIDVIEDETNEKNEINNATNVENNATNVENIAIDMCDVVIDAFDVENVEKNFSWLKNCFDFFACFVRICSCNLMLFENLTKQRLQVNFLININFSRCVFNQW